MNMASISADKKVQLFFSLFTIFVNVLAQTDPHTGVVHLPDGGHLSRVPMWFQMLGKVQIPDARVNKNFWKWTIFFFDLVEKGQQNLIMGTTDPVRNIAYFLTFYVSWWKNEWYVSRV